MDMSFREAVDLYRKIVRRFEKIEGKPWGAEGAMIELSKQVGELAKCIMIQEEHYFFSGAGEENKKKLANELADIFGQVIRIADFYQIDLLKAHMDARQEEDSILSERGV